MSRAVLFCCALLASCGSGEASSPPVPIIVSTFNFLSDRVSISANGTPYGSVASDASTVLTLPGATKAIRVDVSIPLYSDGTAVPSDLTGFNVPVTATTSAIDINNVVAGQAYYTPHITNSTPDTILAATFDGTTVLCISSLSPSIFFYRLAYYRLAASSEFRYYRKHSNCTGPYLYWDYTTIAQAYAAKTGVVSLLGTKLP